MSAETSNDLTVGSAVLPTSTPPPSPKSKDDDDYDGGGAEDGCGGQRGGAGCSVYKPPLPGASRNIRSPLQTVHVHTPVT